MDMQEVRALSLLDSLATLTLAANPLLERLGPRAVDVLVRNACPAVVSLDGRELSGGARGTRNGAAAAPSAEVHYRRHARLCPTNVVCVSADGRLFDGDVH